jgi:serine/threonine protein kinase
MLSHQKEAERFLQNPPLELAAEILSGSQLGPYKGLTLIGKGGMGEVYSSTDIRLDRKVAIKKLPVLFASDPARIARLELEAKLLASLNHPNIAGIYDWLCSL